MDFIFHPIPIYLTVKGPSLVQYVRLRRLEQMPIVGKDGGNEWKSWSKSKIGIHRIHLGADYMENFQPRG